MSFDFKNLSLVEASRQILAGELSSSELTDFYLSQIAQKNNELNLYLEVFADAKAQAEEADKQIKAGKKEPLLGLPLAIKDNILIEGRMATSASKILTGYRATYDAVVIRKLKNAGAIFLGRTNMDEFAMGGSNENSAFGPAHNPHDAKRVTGGSSGGSSGVVAGNMALASLGSDTGGSIRQPASFCGVVGLKPTYGRVSRYGLMAMASSLDQIGPITKTVSDAEFLFNILQGKDSFDSTTTEGAETKMLPEKMVIGVPTGFLSEGLDPEVKENFEQVVKKLETVGHEIREIDLPNFKYALATYYVLMPAEASSNLARFDGVKYGLHVDGADLLADYQKTRAEGFGPEVRRRILLGTYVLSAGYYDAYYGQATRVRNLIRQDYEKIFKSGVHAVLTPTAPTPAFLIGEKTNDPLQMYLEDIFTVPANLAGVPALSVPSGKTATGLPLGVQLASTHFAENILFKLGQEIENFN